MQMKRIEWMNEQSVAEQIHTHKVFQQRRTHTPHLNNNKKKKLVNTESKWYAQYERTEEANPIKMHEIK